MGWGFPTGVEAEATSKLWGVDRRQSVPAPLVHIPQWGVSQAEPRRDRGDLNFQVVSEQAEPTTRDARKKGEYCDIASGMASGEKRDLEYLARMGGEYSVPRPHSAYLGAAWRSN